MQYGCAICHGSMIAYNISTENKKNSKHFHANEKKQCGDYGHATQIFNENGHEERTSEHLKGRKGPAAALLHSYSHPQSRIFEIPQLKFYGRLS